MPVPKKNFLNIAEFSADFERFQRSALEAIDQEPMSADVRARIQLKMMLRQMQIQLAIAQQLAVISGCLGEIVGKAKEK